MHKNQLNRVKLPIRLFLVRTVALFVFLTLVGLQMFVLLYQNPAFSISLRIVAIAVLLGLTYLGGVAHGSLEGALTKNNPKANDENESN